MRSGNPVLKEDTFTQDVMAGDTSEVMTLPGTALKTGVALALVVTSAAYTYHLVRTGQPAQVLMIGGGVAGFILALITCFKRTWAPFTTPLYAVAEGLFLGGISAFYEMRFQGIVLNAVALTMGTLLSLLACYVTGLIKATENFKLGVVAATGGIFLVYMTTFVLSLFGVQVPYIHGSGPIGIGVSLFVVVIAALNLVLDFDFIEKGVEHRAPKYMEWYGAFGLLVTLVWLYLEILRLLAKLQGRGRSSS